MKAYYQRASNMMDRIKSWMRGTGGTVVICAVAGIIIYWVVA